jgi:hypothetical protein
VVLRELRGLAHGSAEDGFQELSMNIGHAGDVVLRMWRNIEMHDFIEWLRLHNESFPLKRGPSDHHQRPNGARPNEGRPKSPSHANAQVRNEPVSAPIEPVSVNRDSKFPDIGKTRPETGSAIQPGSGRIQMSARLCDAALGANARKIRAFLQRPKWTGFEPKYALYIHRF